MWGCICYPARNGSASTVRGHSPASVGAAHSISAREPRTESIRVRKAPELLVDGDFAMGARAAEAAGRLPDYDGENGWTARGLVFLEDGGDFSCGCETDAGRLSWLFGGFRPRTSDFRLRTSGFRPRTSDVGLRTSDLRLLCSIAFVPNALGLKPAHFQALRARLNGVPSRSVRLQSRTPLRTPS